MSKQDKLSLYSDRDLIMEVLERTYKGEAFVRVTQPYAFTSTQHTVNGKIEWTKTNIQYERVEFGHGMDLHTKYVEFDQNGKLINIGQDSMRNY